MLTSGLDVCVVEGTRVSEGSVTCCSWVDPIVEDLLGAVHVHGAVVVVLCLRLSVPSDNL